MPTWNNSKEQAIALAHVEAALQKVEPVVRASNAYFDIGSPSLSVRDEFNRIDYEAFRPNEALPRKLKDIIKKSIEAYDSFGIVHNVIDLMSDFGARGAKIVHPNASAEKFYQAWWKRVRGKSRSERFLNYLYRSANVIVKREYPQSKRIPLRYTFLNPLTVEVNNAELAQFLSPDDFTLSVRVSEAMANRIKHPKTEVDRAIAAKLPQDVRDRIARGERLVPLNPDETSVYHYKRDDWSAWAKPMVAPILKDLAMLEKGKLADMAALDGAISCIRVWKLGNIDARIMPSEAQILRLASMLANNVGGGVMDLVWGPDIDLLETSTAVHQFLGNTKYEPVLQAIFQGLGVPSTLTGSNSKQGFTSTFISLKTLIERLEYGRSVLLEFWGREIETVQKAMGFRKPAYLEFDHMTFSDEAAEKQLFINLADRDLISIETLQEKFGAIPEIEEIRIRREMTKREEGLIPEKAGPFHQVDPLAGEEPASGGNSNGKGKPANKTKGQPGQGRPKKSNDGEKRKTKTVKPRVTADFLSNLSAAEEKQAKISKYVTPAYLKSVGKSTLRELTDKETRDFEQLKFALLCSLSPDSTATTTEIKAAFKAKLVVPEPMQQLLNHSIGQFTEKFGRQPTIENARRLQASVYAIYCGDYDQED